MVSNCWRQWQNGNGARVNGGGFRESPMSFGHFILTKIFILSSHQRHTATTRTTATTTMLTIATSFINQHLFNILSKLVIQIYIYIAYIKYKTYNIKRILRIYNISYIEHTKSNKTIISKCCIFLRCFGKVSIGILYNKYIKYVCVYYAHSLLHNFYNLHITQCTLVHKLIHI